MKKQTFVLSILATGLIVVPLFAAQAGCCGSDMGEMPGGSAMTGHESHEAQTNAAAPKLAPQVAAVFDNYIKIQTSLAKDSLEGVAESAQAIGKTVKGDTTKTFSATLTQQAESMAKADDLRDAREAFKTLSQSLIEYVSKNQSLASNYRQAHCSMADASWLQTGSTVSNPYMGKAMPRCGQFVQSGAVSTPKPPEAGAHSGHMH